MAAPRQKTSDRDRIIDAALALAAEGRWSDVTLGAIASEAKLPLRTVYDEFGSRSEILAAFFRRIDAEVLSEDEEGLGEEEPPRDRLFDVLMRRFEALQPHRDAVATIYADSLCQPASALGSIPQLNRSMAWMLTAAGISAEGWGGLLRVQGLVTLWLATLRVWLRDESEDMARTMAALDRNLRRAEGLLQRMPRRRRRRRYTSDAPEEEVTPPQAPPAEPPTGAPA